MFSCFSYHLVTTPSLSALQRRLSTVLCKVTHKKLISFGCHPLGWCHPGRSAPPLVTPLGDTENVTINITTSQNNPTVYTLYLSLHESLT